MKSTRINVRNVSVTYKEPQCKQVCPVNCIPFNPEWRETPAQLRAKYEHLQAAQLNNFVAAASYSQRT
jgi:hypothetical protein